MRGIALKQGKEMQIKKIDFGDSDVEMSQEACAEEVKEEVGKTKRFKRFEVFTPSSELKSDMIQTNKRFVLDKHLYKLGKPLYSRGFNCKIVMKEKGFNEEAL